MVVGNNFLFHSISFVVMNQQQVQHQIQEVKCIVSIIKKRIISKTICNPIHPIHVEN